MSSSEIYRAGEHKHEEDDELFSYANLLCTYSVLPAAVNAAVELGLFDIIGKKGSEDAGISASEITSLLQASKPNTSFRVDKLDRLLTLLACHSVLNCTVSTLEDGRKEKLYGLSLVGKYFVNNENGESVAMFVRLQNLPDTMEPWYHLKDAILEGGTPWEKAYDGLPLFKYIEENPSFSNIFDGAMTGFSTIVTKKLIETYKGFEGLKSLVDVGGGTGRNLSIILSKYPSIKAINFDLPHVIQNSPPHPGIKHVAGDMFVSIPKADAILLKAVCHNWDDERCVELLKIAYKALPKNGKVIIIDNVLQMEIKPCAESRYLHQADNIMAAYNRGQDRTVENYKALSDRAGFAKFEALARAYGADVMELHK